MKPDQQAVDLSRVWSYVAIIGGLVSLSVTVVTERGGALTIWIALTALVLGLFNLKW